MRQKRLISIILCLILTVSTLPITALANGWEDYAVFPQEFELSNIKAAALYDPSAGEVIWGVNEDQALAPASTVKIMTALLVLEAIERGEISVNDNVTITGAMLSSLPNDASGMLIRIEDGEVLSVLDLLYATMVISDCYACNALAFHVSGSAEKFAELMTERSKELGCTDTVFTNPSGYPDSAMHTTARSLCLIMAEAIKHDLFCKLASTTEYTVGPTNMNGARVIKTQNRLLAGASFLNKTDDYYYPFATSSKTGTSTPSGQCLVSVAEKGDTKLITVVLGGEMVQDTSGKTTENRYSSTIQMFEYGFCIMDYRSIRADMSAKKSAGIQAHHLAAEQESLKAIKDDAVTVSEFYGIRAGEAAVRTKLIKYIAAATVTVFLIFVIFRFVKKNNKKVKLHIK